MSAPIRWYRELPARRLWIAVGWALVGLIVSLSLVTLPQIGPDLPQGDKLKHVAAYFALTAWFAQISATPRVLCAHALGFIALGAALEGLQSLTPMRLLEGADVLANTAGVLLAVILARGSFRNALAIVLGGGTKAGGEGG